LQITDVFSANIAELLLKKHASVFLVLEQIVWYFDYFNTTISKNAILRQVEELLYPYWV